MTGHTLGLCLCGEYHEPPFLFSVSQEDYDSVLAACDNHKAEVSRLNALLSLKATEKAAQLNEDNGSWKRSQQIVVYLRARASAIRSQGDAWGADSLEECADEIEVGKVLVP